jgi:hypothetical protein
LHPTALHINSLCLSVHITHPPNALNLLPLQVYPAMMALGLSALICYTATQLAALWSMPSQSITIITGLTVAAATLLPRQLAPLAPSAEGLALLMMQVGWCESRVDMGGRGAVC